MGAGKKEWGSRLGGKARKYTSRILALNKADKLSRNELKPILSKFTSQLDNDAQIHLVSSIKNWRQRGTRRGYL